jgi:hypothetical protein
VATSTSAQSTAIPSVPIVVLGTDAVLAAQPGTAVQLAHACLKAGFANVIPASWGDELIASATLRKLVETGPGPAIACSCPIVAHRLLSASADLRPVLLPFVPPPVAVSRYVRLLARPNRARITYVGNCPGAIDDTIDIRMSPDALISMLAERHIVIEDQPRVFESIIPADRRRFRSQPGGLPAVDALWSAGGARRLVEATNADLVATIAQHVIANENVLIDAAIALGCVCSGAAAVGGREAVVAIEPPRASSAVIDDTAPIQLELNVPMASRTPVDVMAVSPLSTPSLSHPALPLGRPATEPTNISPPPVGGWWDSPRRPTPPGGVNSSDLAGNARQPDSRDRRALPRAYIVRRRPSPRSTPVVPPDISPPAPPEETPTVNARPDDHDEATARGASEAQPKNDEEEDDESAFDDVGTAEPIADVVEEEPEAPVATVEHETTVDLLPMPRAALLEPTAPPPAPEIATPLRVVENGTSYEPPEISRVSNGNGDQPRILTATTSAARATKTAVRDLRDAFMVTVSSPGDTVTRSQPPERATGSIGGVTPLFNEPVTVVRVRNLVLLLLGFVALIVVLAAGVSLLVERRLNPPPAASAPVTP